MADKAGRKGETVSVAEQASLSEAVRKAIAEGHVTATWAEAEISAKTRKTIDGIDKAISREYIRLEAQDGIGMAALCNGKVVPKTPTPEGEDKRTDTDKAFGACDFFNYGFELHANRRVRTAMTSELEGPEKAVKKAVVGLVAAGYGAAEIREMVPNSPKFKGVDGIVALVDAALAA